MVKKGQGKGKGKGRASIKVSDHSDSSDHHKSSTPLARRYQTRSLLAQCATASASAKKTSRYPLRNVKGIFDSPSLTSTSPSTELLATSTPASRNLNSGVPPEPQVRISTANFSKSPNQAESSKSLHPTSTDCEDFEKFAINFLDTNQGFCNPLIPPTPTAAHKVAPELSMPQRDDSDTASTANGNNQSQGSCAHGNEQSMCLARSSSLNLTQIAEMIDNSANEVDSAVDPALVTVKGYRVKEEVAPLLRSIFTKYGDIAKDCSLKSIKGRSMILEIVCAIYLNLKNRKPTAITSWEIEDILAEVDDVEATKVEVGWLRKRVEDISEALQEIRSYTARKEVLTRKTIEAEMLARELEDLTKRTQLQQSKVAAKQAEVKESNEALMNSKEKMILFKQPLVQGLL